jgi:hypothetical protein
VLAGVIGRVVVEVAVGVQGAELRDGVDAVGGGDRADRQVPAVLG